MIHARQLSEDHKPIIDGWDFLDISDDGGDWEPASRKDCLQMAGIGIFGMFLCLFIVGLAHLAFYMTPKPDNGPPAAISTQR